MQTQKQSPALAGEPGSGKQTPADHITTIAAALRKLAAWIVLVTGWTA